MHSVSKFPPETRASDGESRRRAAVCHGEILPFDEPRDRGLRLIAERAAGEIMAIVCFVLLIGLFAGGFIVLADPPGMASAFAALH